MNERMHFDRLVRETGSTWWGRLTRAGQFRDDKKIQLFEELVRPQEGEFLIEVGCGAGEFTKRLAPFRLKVAAFDLSENCVRQTCQRVGGMSGFQYAIADITRIPFRDNCFDICFGVSILHHVHLTPAWEEIVRVCRNGARFFFSEPNMLNPQMIAQKNISWLKRRLADSEDETAFIRWNLERTLNSIPGTRARVKNIDFIHPLLPARYLAKAERLSDLLERIPLVKEISGSLAIYGVITK